MAQGDELNALKECYSRLLDICDRLEAIADGLPGNLPLADCRWVAAHVVEEVTRSHALEERVLLPMLLASDRKEIRLAAGRLRQEHEFDNQAAIEIEEGLADLVAGGNTLSPDATGYLLRSFFESMRRHVYAELDLISLMKDMPPTSRSLH